MNTHKIEINKKKETDFHEWYNQIVFNTELLEYYDVSGCYAVLPKAYSMWEKIQKYLDDEFKCVNVKNVYFPMLITENNLNKESNFIKGFTPEVIWVSKTGTDNADTDNRLAIRPTSECAFYPTFSKYIRSHQNLPLSWNQWCSVMRWECSPTPFIRSKEFLWQEGHSAFESSKQAKDNVAEMLEIYRNIYENVLMVPVMTGKKTELEKFAGAEATYTIETFIKEVGKGIQCCTSHDLGQNFSKMFNIKFQTKDGNIDHVWQTSWGFTTRSIGVMLMMHSDDKGLVIPSKISEYQVVIVPITKSKDDPVIMKKYIDNVVDIIRTNNKDIRLYVDDDSSHNPGYKYNFWEVNGVPIRLEIGTKEIANNTVAVYRRDINKKEFGVTLTNNYISDLLDAYDKNLFNRALDKIFDSYVKVNVIEDLNKYENNGLFVTICENADCELKVKELSNGKKSQCYHMFGMSGKFILNTKCIICDKTDNLHECAFAKSF